MNDDLGLSTYGQKQSGSPSQTFNSGFGSPVGAMNLPSSQVHINAQGAQYSGETQFAPPPGNDGLRQRKAENIERSTPAIPPPTCFDGAGGPSNTAGTLKLSRSPVVLPRWVYLWFFISSLLVGLDCVYVLSIEYSVTQMVPKALLEWWGWYGESDSQYSVTGQGIKDSSGWMPTQSKFNVAELLLQLAVLCILPSRSPSALLTAMVSSVCTLWKTLIYMSIIAHSPDPVMMVPLLSCTGLSPLPANAAAVQAALQKDDCAVQFFKFQFNFWWIICPALIVVTCWKRISAAFQAIENQK